LRALEDFENYIAATETAFFNLFEQRESLLNVKRSIEALVGRLISNVNVKNLCGFEIIANIEFGNRFVSHSVKTAIIAVIIGKSIPIPETKLATVTTGALLHDIGNVLSKNPLLKSFFSGVQNAEDLRQKHPIISADIISEFLGFSGEIAQTARNHHEQLNGSGFPQKLHAGDINTFDRVVFAANFIEELLMRSDYPGSEQIFNTLFYAFKKYPWKFDTAIQTAFHDFAEKPPISRRRYERANITISSTYHTADSFHTYPARILDVSGGGIRMRCKEVMDVGTILVLSFSIGHGMAFSGIPCKVVRRVAEGGLYVYGVDFRDKSGTVAGKIDKYVQRSLQQG
jgi:putative nucleotidyltransferase with HDIG domain